MSVLFPYNNCAVALIKRRSRKLQAFSFRQAEGDTVALTNWFESDLQSGQELWPMKKERKKQLLKAILLPSDCLSRWSHILCSTMLFLEWRCTLEYKLDSRAVLWTRSLSHCNFSVSLSVILQLMCLLPGIKCRLASCCCEESFNRLKKKKSSIYNRTWVRRLSDTLVQMQREGVFIRCHANPAALRNRMRSGRVLPEVRRLWHCSSQQCEGWAGLTCFLKAIANLPEFRGHYKGQEMQKKKASSLFDFFVLFDFYLSFSIYCLYIKCNTIIPMIVNYL